MNEYQGYDVNELRDMTSLDNADKLDDIGTGWANTAQVLDEMHEALNERLQALQQKWTSASSGPYFQKMMETMAFVERAKSQAENRGEAVGRIASTARWARDHVQTQHTEYLKASLRNTIEGVGEATGSKSPGKQGLNGPWGVYSSPSDELPTDAEIRKPFDEKARKYMKVAVEEYEGNKPAIDSEVAQVKPIHIDKKWSDGQDSWAGDGGSGSNTTDMTGLSAASYGGNAVGGSPELQAGGGHALTNPGHSAPVGPNITHSSSGVPVGGNPFGPGKPPTAPPRLPNGPVSNARTTMAPRGSVPARTTPGLPNRATGANGRPGPMNGSQNRVPNRVGQPNGNGARNRWAGRGLQKSQMEPVNRVGQPRKAGEVMGARGTKSTKPGTGTDKAPARRVESTVVRGAKGKNNRGNKTRTDNTKRGYSSRVINQRNRLSEANGHSRTPLVAKKLDTTAKPVPFGKREPVTTGKRIRSELSELRAKRRQRIEQQEGLSRPVIGNGVTDATRLDDAVPTPREPVKTPEELWQPQTPMVPGVIGKRTWDPDLVEHDPGPLMNARLQARKDFESELDARVAAIDPGPKAFDVKRRLPDTSTWPGA